MTISASAAVPAAHVKGEVRPGRKLQHQPVRGEGCGRGDIKLAVATPSTGTADTTAAISNRRNIESPFTQPLFPGIATSVTGSQHPVHGKYPGISSGVLPAKSTCPRKSALQQREGWSPPKGRDCGHRASSPGGGPAPVSCGAWADRARAGSGDRPPGAVALEWRYRRTGVLKYKGLCAIT